MNETIDHTFQCESPARRKAVKERMSALRPKILEWGTSAQLAEAMYVGAWAWIRGEQTPSPETLAMQDDAVGSLILQAFEEQSALGWNAFYRGFWTSTWQLAQEAHWAKCGKTSGFDTGESWSGKAQNWFF